MGRYLIRRTLFLILVLFIVSFLTCLIFIKLPPGDPARIFAGRRTTPRIVETIRHNYGLDRPWYVQYASFVGNAVQGDFGYSLKYRGQPAMGLVFQRLPATLALVAGALAFAAVPLTDHVVVVAVLLAVYIGHSVVWNVLAASVRQKATPARLMGRAGSVSRLLGMSGLALGALLGGTLASVFGLRPPFLVAGSLFLVAAVVCVLAGPRFRAWEKGQEARESAGEH